MELASMRLFNFQCYKDSQEIPFNRMAIFVGENDSGKSCILKALDIFLNNKLPSSDMFHALNGQHETTSSIILSFRINPEEEIPKEYTVDGMVTLKKEFSLNENGQIIANTSIKRYLFEVAELNSINDLKADQLKDLSAMYNLEYINVADAKEKLIRFTHDSFESLPKGIGYSSIKWSEILPLLPIFEYYDSSDYGNPQRHVETTLKNVYRSFFYNYDENGTESLKAEFIPKMDEIKQVLDERIQESLKKKVVSKIDKIKNIYGDYSIDFSGGFSLSDIMVDYGTGPHSVNSIGEGSKKRLFLAIIEWDKEIKIKEAHKMIIRGYDEPDASLHYSAQKEMFYTLRDLSNNSSSQVQVIICTHSVSMIDRAPARIINHVIQENGISHIDYLKDNNEEDIKEFLDNISEISGIKNSSLFFEKCFVIVEGDTEENALPIIYRKLVSRSLLEDGVVLINLKGNSSWESFLKLLNRNKSEATILFLDRDIQNDRSRKVTADKLKQINFADEFLRNNVIFVGNKEFEDIFSDELICKCFNKYWPKIEGKIWEIGEISCLRSCNKFSDCLMKSIGKYINDNCDRTIRKPGKPEFGRRIAEIATEDELLAVTEVKTLIEKINNIII